MRNVKQMAALALAAAIGIASFVPVNAQAASSVTLKANSASKIKNKTYSGNLVIASSVRKSKIILSNVTVKGSILVRKKGLKLTLKDTTVKTLTVEKTATKVVVSADADSSITTVNMNSANSKVKGDADVTTVYVNASGATVNLPGNTTVKRKTGVSEPKVENSVPSDSAVMTESENKYHKNTYNTDTRMADGYPKVRASKSKSEIVVTYRLKTGVASVDKPASIYYCVTTCNTDYDATTSAVMKGHLSDDYKIIYSQWHDYMQVYDDQEHSRVFRFEKRNYTKGLSCFSAIIDHSGVPSPDPYMEYFDDATVRKLGLMKIEPEKKAFVNREGDTVTLYYKGDLDTSSIPSASDFTITSKGKRVPVSSVRVDKPYSSDNYISDVRNSHVTIGLSQKIDTSAKTTLSYKPGKKPIEDMYGNPSMDIDGLTVGTASQGLDIHVSSDNKYLAVTVPVSFSRCDIMSPIFKVYGSAGSETEKSDHVASINEQSIYYLCDLSVGKVTSIEVDCTGLINAAGDTLGQLKADGLTPDTETIRFTSASYDKKNKRIAIRYTGKGTIDKSSRSFVYFFVKTSDGKTDYRLIDGSAKISGNEIYITQTGQDVDLSKVTAIKYNPYLDNYNYWVLKYVSGRPLPSTDYIKVR